jgi:HAD superfamily hydrolase (TIGR01490 family)
VNKENILATGKQTLVLFDFDGTLTHKDTLFEFTRYAVGNGRFIFGLVLLAFPLVLQKIKLVSAQRAKEMFLSHYFGNTSLEVFNSLCNSFCVGVLPLLVRQKAMDAILQHQREGARVIIISASPINWIRPWAIKNNIETIATELEIKDNRLTGKIAGANCNGEEKVRRLNAYLDIKQYDQIIAYGDTAGDLPMLTLATTKFFKPFRE